MKLEHGKMESFSLKNPCSQESVTQELAIWRWLQVKFPKLFVKFLSLDISLYLREEMMGIVLLFNQHSTIDVGFFFNIIFLSSICLQSLCARCTAYPRTWILS
jgi:hypothetical protein